MAGPSRRATPPARTVTTGRRDDAPACTDLRGDRCRGVRARIAPSAVVDADRGRRGAGRTQLREAHPRHAAAVEIIPFESRYRADFKRLNLEWLHRYFRVEPIDEVVLSDPEALVRDGGHLYLARLHGRIVGTCGLLAEEPGVMELSKMSVTDACQGLGIGRRLMDVALEKYATLGCRRLYLETNSILTPAIRLYESVGFRHQRRPGGPSTYERADVYMVWHAPRARRTRTG